MVGVLAVQGGFAAHARVLEALGARVREVRLPADLEGVRALVLPGGESTAISLGIERAGLREPLRAAIGSGMPVLGSCAGLIMLDREHLGCMDILAERNAFGRQVRSFEADVPLAGIDGPPLRGVFIRAPWIAEHGPAVEVLGLLDGHPVAARQGEIVAVAFHSELTGEDRLHRRLLERARELGASAGS
ncbi:MAG: pyridoxal 5'-phosphate synthase glutaminase subunit PdxT [Acidobacteriota bacterium]|nr:pyridoxal 5'-phosphate synthase glutaminase subunit PdxT [Acidobacteriota bacterium]